MACSPSDTKNSYLALFLLGDDRAPKMSVRERCSDDIVWP
jgi:hypothetical protein